jgi:hypothetical protein
MIVLKFIELAEIVEASVYDLHIMAVRSFRSRLIVISSCIAHDECSGILLLPFILDYIHHNLLE